MAPSPIAGARHWMAGAPAGFLVALALLVPLRAHAQVAPLPCVGDCNGDRTVTVDELLLGVQIDLGGAPVTACPAFDPNADRTVSLNELITGVNNALDGCP